MFNLLTPKTSYVGFSSALFIHSYFRILPIECTLILLIHTLNLLANELSIANSLCPSSRTLKPVLIKARKEERNWYPTKHKVVEIQTDYPSTLKITNITQRLPEGPYQCFWRITLGRFPTFLKFTENYWGENWKSVYCNIRQTFWGQ